MFGRWKGGMVCAGFIIACVTQGLSQGPVATADQPVVRPIHIVPACVVRKTMDKTLEAGVPSDPIQSTPGQQGYYIQAGTFAIEANALRLRRHLAEEGYRVSVRVFTARNGRVFHVVSVGPFENMAEAGKQLGKINASHKIAAMLVAVQN